MQSELNQFDMIYDKMLEYAKINIRNRPCISSFNNCNDPISFLVIPTLEDLKSALFEPGDLVQEVGYPLKVTTKDDMESAAFLTHSPPGTLSHHGMIPTVVSRITGMATEYS
jgi:hypothetical protein